MARLWAQDEDYSHLIKRANSSIVQCIVQIRVALKCGYDFLYVPGEIMEEVESKQSALCEGEVLDLMWCLSPFVNRCTPTCGKSFCPSK